MKKIQVVKAILRKKNKIGGQMFPDIKLYYKDIVIKTLCNQQEHKHKGKKHTKINGKHKQTKNKPILTWSLNL